MGDAAEGQGTKGRWPAGVVRAGLAWLGAVIALAAHKELLRNLADERYPRDAARVVQLVGPGLALLFLVVYGRVRSARARRGRAPSAVDDALAYAIFALAASVAVAVAPIGPIARTTLLGAVGVLAGLLAGWVGIERGVPPAARAALRWARASGGRRRGAIVLWALTGAALVGAAGLMAEAVVLRPRNTLHENGRWVSRKATMARNVLGAISYVTTRPALRRNRLDLHEWHGFQEVWLKEAVNADEVRFSLWIDDEAYATFLFGDPAEEHGGVILSRRPALPAATVRVEPTGSFAARSSLDSAPEIEGGWRRCVWKRRGDGFALEVDGEAWARGGPAPPGAFRFGFRGSAHEVLVDDVIALRDGSVVFEESFAHARGRLRAVAIFLGALAGLTAAATAVARRSRAPRRPPAVFHAALLALLSFVGAGALFVFDDVERSQLHPDDPPLFDYEVRTDTPEAVGAAIRDTYTAPPPAGVARAIVIGSSQTRGSGVLAIEDGFVERLPARLERRLGFPVQCINAGISGAESFELLERYAAEWIDLDIDACVINLSNNDTDPERFATTLKRFIALNRKRGIPTLLCLEANDVERPERRLAPNHAAMRRVAEEENVPLADMHARMARHTTEGFLCWDKVHFTSFGYGRLAEHFADALAPLLEGAGSARR